MVGGQEPAWLRGLEGTARRIAEIDHSPLRVLAGPGTGKTFSLMRRVARMLVEGAAPSRILVATFTRTAAHDLEQEVARLGEGRVERVVAGTLHSFCFGLLSRADVLEMTGRVPRPLLTFEERFLRQDLHHEGFGGLRDCQKRLEAFGAAWARLQTDDPGWPREPLDRRFQGFLDAWLRFHRAMLVAEMITETLRFLRDNPASLYRRHFRHVLVDEYQDLNRAEQVLLDLLAENGTLTVIGDEDQSIYSFKYAHPQGIADFDRQHADTHDETLVDCRRCPQLVVTLANSLISNNPHRQVRPLRPSPANPPGEVRVVQFRTMRDEAAAIADFIRERIQSEQVTAGQVLVLCPRRQFGYAIRDALQLREIPAHSFFHEEALEGNPTNAAESRAQQAFTLLTLLAQPDDRVALRCWCGFASASLGAPGWARLRAHCQASGDSPRRALERLDSGDIQLPYTRGLLDGFRELQRRLAPMTTARGQALVDLLFPQDQEWAEQFRAFALTIADPDLTAAKLLDFLRSAVTQPELPTDVDYVRVMSLHKSKGLTADLVVVVGCIWGLIPTIDSRALPAEQQSAIEEQRRLFYVAITRTRKVLILSSVMQVPLDLAWKMRVSVAGRSVGHANTIATRFLDELGPSRPASAFGLT